ncbi:hypothetical protein EV426DRAFT_709044 [Tirmania nivea]|nr:hypothetical protein EV426DRAFT_709044 [Tirmania nivea]
MSVKNGMFWNSTCRSPMYRLALSGIIWRKASLKDGPIFCSSVSVIVGPIAGHIVILVLTNQADVDYALDQFKGALKPIKLLSRGCYAFKILSGSTPNHQYRRPSFQRMDYIVSAAQARDIRLIIPFVNNLGDYGGIKVYVDSLANDQGHDALYTNPAIKNTYKDYVRALISRNTTSPATFAGSWPMRQAMLA